jgi:hypothetical protein
VGPADLEATVAEVRRHIAALVVLVGTYHQRHGCGANDPRFYRDWSRWQPEDLPTFSVAAQGVANRTGCLFVDALTVLRGADNTLDPGCCHLNDLGHQLVGNAVFREIVLRA